MNNFLISSDSTAEPSNALDEPYISVRSLWKVFGRNPERALEPEYEQHDRAAIQEELGCVVALRDVSFDVLRGQTFVVMGLSGSGKSTLVRCLIRLIEPTAGTVHMDDEEITGMSDNGLIEFRRKSIAMVFQHYGLMPHRNVLDNAAWGLEVQGASKDERYSRTREVLELVGLGNWEDAYPRQLSGGMQQRVGLARALAVDPDILLMDEPFSGLDPLIRRQMQDELLRLQTELRKTIVFITHDLNEALKLGDRIAIMHDGAVAQIGSPEDIVLRPEDEYVGEFTQDVRRESILTAASLTTEAKVVVSSQQSPTEALAGLRASEASVALVVDESRKYLGTLDLAQARKAVSDRADVIGDCQGYWTDEVTPVSTSTVCDEIIPLCIATELPIPVVDEQGILVGEVHRLAVAQAISGGTNEGD